MVFAVLALLALTLVAGAGIVVVRRLATEQALTEARQLTEVSARVVEGRVNDALLTGDAESLGSVASAVVNAVLHDPVVRVKIWTHDGRDRVRRRPGADREPVCPGRRGRRRPRTRRGGAEVSDLSAPENRYERQFGELLEVYTQIETPDGTPLLFETYQLVFEHRRPSPGAARHVRSGPGRHLGRPRALDGANRMDPRHAAYGPRSSSGSG